MQCCPPFAAGPPEWACGYGQDQYGYYADFGIATGSAYWEFTMQRMRWITAGTFLMGSPDNEAERVGTEGPQHEVTLSNGFWLAETTCTQRLWRAVVETDPSRFKGDERPVENVSHDDVQKFLSRLADRVPGLQPKLPTEAQWEYACRAGTATPFSFGGTINTGQSNFDGNYPHAGGPKGVYRRETVDVKSFPPNRWGLYQMHGNVWEWCSDWYGLYVGDSQVDPTGPPTGSRRVVRGGNWSYGARGVRSACRYGHRPGSRGSDLGFRVLSSASSSQPATSSQ